MQNYFSQVGHQHKKLCHPRLGSQYVHGRQRYQRRQQQQRQQKQSQQQHQQQSTYEEAHVGALHRACSLNWHLHCSHPYAMFWGSNVDFNTMLNVGFTWFWMSVFIWFCMSGFIWLPMSQLQCYECHSYNATDVAVTMLWMGPIGLTQICSQNRCISYDFICFSYDLVWFPSDFIWL